MLDHTPEHIVVLGMTGSGKTGLGVGLVEDVALEDTPLILVDLKGDLVNVGMVPTSLSTEGFRPYAADDAEAARAAATSKEALANEGVGEAVLRAWHDQVEVRILTPGSESGVPVDLIGAVTEAPPPGLGDEALREHVAGCVSALSALLGDDDDPASPASALLGQLLHHAFARGENLPFDVLIPQVVDPPFAQIGYLATDRFIAPADRLKLARALNAVVASPSFAAWRAGVPLDPGAWLARGDKTPVTILSLAHLDDAQRRFFLTAFLHRLIAWMRRQPGTDRRRAMLYLDEVAGLLPPHPRTPPTKGPLLTLLKQARAFGLVVMLATQNPVDLDYKALGNARIWFLGAMPARQDRDRVLTGLRDAGIDGQSLDETIAGLQRRQFVVRDRHGTRIVRSRHTLSWLRGPVPRARVAAMARASGPTVEAARAPAHLGAAPSPPGGLPARWLDLHGLAPLGLPQPDEAAIVWRPALYGRWTLRFEADGWEEERVIHRLLWPLDDPSAEPVATALPDELLWRSAPAAGRYATAPGWADAGALDRLRQAWVQALIFDEVADGPEGPVRADRGDCRPMGWVWVWVPCER